MRIINNHISIGKVIRMNYRDNNNVLRTTTITRRSGLNVTHTKICIHNNGNKNSNPNGERGWLVNPSNTRSASWHECINEEFSVIAIPWGEEAYHSATTIGNRESYSIEICEKDFYKVYPVAVKRVAFLLNEQGWGVDRVTTHNAYSGKNCPSLILPIWNKFIKDIETELNALKKGEVMISTTEIRRILTGRVGDVEGWIAFINQHKNDEVGKHLPELIHDLNLKLPFSQILLNGCGQGRDWDKFIATHCQAGIGRFFNVLVERIYEGADGQSNKIDEVQEVEYLRIEFGNRNDRVKLWQEMLNQIGGYGLVPDGSFGNLTRSATNQFQRGNGLAYSNIVSKELWDLVQLYLRKNAPIKVWGKRLHNANVYFMEVNPNFAIINPLNIGRNQRLSTQLNGEVQLGKKPLGGINLGFFGGTVNHIGLYLANGSFTSTPRADFIESILKKDGKLYVDNIKESTTVQNIRQDVDFAVSTGGGLIKEGKKWLELNARFSGTSNSPRTAFGQKSNGNFLLVVVDGRSTTSVGMTHSRLADILLAEGVVEATTCDGGGSSTIAVVRSGRSRVLNVPSDNSERNIGSSLIVYEKR